MYSYFHLGYYEQTQSAGLFSYVMIMKTRPQV